ncbi:MAG: hypothetical protein H6773_04245 [Pseudomonadales bacterium]|nr:hypothetical protein [Pseudomonadales bacterium]
MNEQNTFFDTGSQPFDILSHMNIIEHIQKKMEKFNVSERAEWYKNILKRMLGIFDEMDGQKITLDMQQLFEKLYTETDLTGTSTNCNNSIIGNIQRTGNEQLQKCFLLATIEDASNDTNSKNQFSPDIPQLDKNVVRQNAQNMGVVQMELHRVLRYWLTPLSPEKRKDYFKRLYQLTDFDENESDTKSKEQLVNTSGSTCAYEFLVAWRRFGSETLNSKLINVIESPSDI